MAGAGTINVKFSAQTAAFEAGVSKVNGLLGQVGSTLNLVKGLAVGFLAWKGADFVHGMMQSIDTTAKLADRIGVTTEAMVGLQHAGDLAGVSAESMAKSIEKMGANLADAQLKATPTSKALADIGVTLNELRGMSPDQQLGRIADGLNQLGGAGARAAAAQDIFGKSGLELQQMLAGGSKALREAKEEADAFGISFSRIDAFKVEQANDAMTRLGAVIRGGLTQAAISISPVIEAISTKFVESAKSAGGFGKITLSVMEAIKDAAGVLADAWNYLTAGWNAAKAVFYTLIRGVLIGMDNLVTGIQYVSGLWDNFTRLVSDSVTLLVKTFGWLWAEAKRPLSAFVQFAGEQFSAMLHIAAAGMDRVNAGLATSLREAAFAVGVVSGDASAQAVSAAKKAGEEMSMAAENAALSWEYLGRVTNLEGSPMLQGLAEKAHEAGIESAVAYSEAFNSAIKQTGSSAVADWFTEIEALSQASAERSAAAVAAKLEADNNASNQRLYDNTMAWATKTWEDLRLGWERAAANREERETWVTEMFGHQAEKQAAWDKRTLDQRLDYGADFFGNLSRLQNTSSRKMFEIGKIAAYGQAVVSTAAGIARQFADLPIWAAIPAAAAVAAAGIAQIASISSTSFGGGGSVSSAGGSVALANGEPSGVLAAGAQGAVNPTVNRLEVSISGLSDDAVLSGSMVRRLIEQINEGQRDGSRLDVVAA